NMNPEIIQRELTLLRDCPAPDAIKKCIIVALKQSERVALEERKNMKKIKSFMKPTGASKLSKALKQLMGLMNTKAISMVEHGLSLIIDSKMRPVLGENKTVADVLKMKKEAYVELKPILKSKDKQCRKAANTVKKILKKCIKTLE
ncbi:unnamed protein product, partial [Owenia fusiformis]